MITIYRVQQDGELREELDPKALSRVREDGTGTYWVDVNHGSVEDLERLVSCFAFHPVTLKTLAGEEQHARVHGYPGYYFLVAYTLEIEEKSTRFRPIEVDIYLGPNYVITVHDEPVSLIAETKRNWRDQPRSSVRTSELFHVLFDTLIEDYEMILHRTEQEYHELKRTIYEDCDSVTPASFAALEERMFALEEVALPIRKDFTILLHEEQGLFRGDPLAMGYFRELHHSAERIIEELERYAARVDSAFQAYAAVMSNTLAEQGNQMNRSMSRLTGVMFSLGLAGILTGLFGMNFAFPGRDTSPGFWVALLLTSGATLAALGYARARHWF